MNDMKLIDKDGNFDAKKARQLLYEFARDNAMVNQAHRAAEHMGLSSEERYLFMAVALLQENIGMRDRMMDQFRYATPTFTVQPTKDGPFDTQSANPSFFMPKER